MAAIKIVTKKEGFRRAGLAHYGTEVYPDGHFSPEQLELLMAEKNLEVTVVDEGRKVKAETTVKVEPEAPATAQTEPKTEAAPEAPAPAAAETESKTKAAPKPKAAAKGGKK